MSLTRALVLTTCWAVGLTMVLGGWFYLGAPAARARGTAVVVAMTWLAVVSCIVFFLPRVHFRYARYALDRRGLDIRGGALWHHAVAVPRSRLQHADVTQGPVERWYGLGTLVVHTAGFGEGAITLNGLDYDRALAIRDLLLEHDDADPI